MTDGIWCHFTSGFVWWISEAPVWDFKWSTASHKHLKMWQNFHWDVISCRLTYFIFDSKYYSKNVIWKTIYKLSEKFDYFFLLFIKFSVFNIETVKSFDLLLEFLIWMEFVWLVEWIILLIILDNFKYKPVNRPRNVNSQTSRPILD